MTSIKVEPVTRIESHGSLTLEFSSNGIPERAYFSTPVLRGFEAFLIDAPIERVPWLASRICGVCPVSHSVNASQTLEKALGINIPETAKTLREMLVLAQLIDSHALSFVILSLPDILPKKGHSIVDVRKDFPEIFESGLRLHSLGREMTSMLGGRNVHPVNVRIGGMGTNPIIDSDLDIEKNCSEILEIVEHFLDSCKDWLSERGELVDEIGNIQSNYMALSNNGVVSFVEGDVMIVNPDGSELAVFDPDSYSDHIGESTEPHTYMKLPFLKEKGKDNGIVRVNCLARANVSSSYGTTVADREIRDIRETYGSILEPSLLSHLTRLVEIVYATERLTELAGSPTTGSDDTLVPVETTVGEAVGCLEAPRGTLFHHYAVEDGHITKANMIVATQNNALAVNHGLTATLDKGIEKGRSEDQIVHHCEMLVRAYDPCISCSTHITTVEED